MITTLIIISVLFLITGVVLSKIESHVMRKRMREQLINRMRRIKIRDNNN